MRNGAAKPASMPEPETGRPAPTAAALPGVNPATGKRGFFGGLFRRV
jgi:hypothetical protein